MATGTTSATTTRTTTSKTTTATTTSPPTTSTTTQTTVDTDGDGLSNQEETELGTDPTIADTDGDGRDDNIEAETPGLSPLKEDIAVIDGSPNAGLENETLEQDTRKAVGFLAELPENETKRDAVVVNAATEICNGHDEVVEDIDRGSSAVGDRHLDTYRIVHTAEVLHDVLGADINPAVIERRMRTARKATGIVSKYTPVIGSYRRLHNASCAVKAGEPGAKQDFYIASAELTADLVLAQHQVVYKASFRTTGYIARKTGLMRLARVCGYKCVGLVESETYRFVNNGYSVALDQVAIEATEGNLTDSGWNATTRNEVGEYVRGRSNSTVVDGRLVHNQTIVWCVSENYADIDPWTLASEFSGEVVDAVKVMALEQRVPQGVDLSFVEELGVVRECLK